MTERLYYHDSLLLDFDSAVTSVSDDKKQLVLARTAFYPTSGGQQFDTGTLDGVPVIDVVDDGDDIIHHLAAPWGGNPGDSVHGAVHRERRFHHMQQHTGQHLLSAILADRWSMPTVSVHFGDRTNTVDVTTDATTPDVDTASDNFLATLEREANELIAADLPVTVSMEDAATATRLRKPSDRSGELRIITIHNLDRSACGGTHVSSTGQIGGLLLRRSERTRGALRIEFVCGLRAAQLAHEDHATLTETARLLSAAPAELPELVANLQQRVKELERTQRQMGEALASYKAQEIWSAHTDTITDPGTDPHTDSIRRIHIPVPHGQASDARDLAAAIAKLGATIVLVTAANGNNHSLLLAASDDSGVDAGKEMKAFMASFGGRGGGSSRLAQGTVSDDAAIQAIVSALGCSVR